MKQKSIRGQKKPPDIPPSGPPEMPGSPGPTFPEIPREEPEIIPFPEKDPKRPQEIPPPEKKDNYAYRLYS